MIAPVGLVALTFFWYFQSTSSASDDISALEAWVIPLYMAVILVVRMIVTAIGVAAGLALSNRQAGAVTLAKLALGASAAIDLFVYTTPYFPNTRVPGDTIYYIAASLAYHAAWLTYLFRSRRVRNTY